MIAYRIIQVPTIQYQYTAVTRTSRACLSSSPEHHTFPVLISLSALNRVLAKFFAARSHWPSSGSEGCRAPLGATTSAENIAVPTASIVKNSPVRIRVAGRQVSINTWHRPDTTPRVRRSVVRYLRADRDFPGTSSGAAGYTTPTDIVTVLMSFGLGGLEMKSPHFRPGKPRPPASERLIAGRSR